MDPIPLLNELLEAERAGVVVLDELRALPEAEPIGTLLDALRSDEARYAGGLASLMRERGTDPASGTGAFVDKVRAEPTFADKLALLNRGQLWVAKRIERALPDLEDAGVITFLEEMARRHRDNVSRAEAALPRAEGAPELGRSPSSALGERGSRSTPASVIVARGDRGAR